MGLFGSKLVRCPRGVWTTIISTSFAQLPTVFEVRMKRHDGSAVSGLYERKGSRWLFAGHAQTGPLAERMAFERGLWNTFFSVRVRPDADSIAEID